MVTSPALRSEITAVRNRPRLKLAGSQARRNTTRRQTPSAEYAAQLRALLLRIDYAAVEALTARLFEAWRADRAVFLIGNGGSAATATHHACDYVNAASARDAHALRAICLSDATSTLTALANDVAFDEVFRESLERYARPGDVLVAISCSGTSANVVNGVHRARSAHMYVVALTGRAGGVIGRLADLHVNVPSSDFGLTEDVHLAIGHMVARGLRARIAHAGPPRRAPRRAGEGEAQP